MRTKYNFEINRIEKLLQTRKFSELDRNYTTNILNQLKNEREKIFDAKELEKEKREQIKLSRKKIACPATGGVKL